MAKLGEIASIRSDLVQSLQAHEKIADQLLITLALNELDEWTEITNEARTIAGRVIIGYESAQELKVRRKTVSRVHAAQIVLHRKLLRNGELNLESRRGLRIGRDILMAVDRQQKLGAESPIYRKED